MDLYIITAFANNQVIGIQNSLPWSLPADTTYLKETVQNYPVIMGRNSYESEDAVLSFKKNVILSSRSQLDLKPNCFQARNWEEALELIQDDEVVFSLGGHKVYELSLTIAARLYITRIYHDFEGDTHFPEINWNEWELMEERQFTPDEMNPYNYAFLIYKKV